MINVNGMVLTAVVRSVVQRLLEVALATTLGMQIANFLAEAGVPLNKEAIVTAVSVFLFGLIVAIVNWLGPKFDWINKFISLGLSRTAPAYVPNDADAVLSVAHHDAEDTVKKVDTPPPGPNEG